MVTDSVDGQQKINGHEFTIEWLLKSLRENDETFKKLHGGRGVKEVSHSDTYVDIAKKAEKCVD